METHEPDPTGNGQRDPWETVALEFAELKSMLSDSYTSVTNNGGPSEDEIKYAFAVLAGAASQVVESASNSMKDPEVREQIKDVVSSLATAVGTTMTELGAELAKMPADPPDQD